MLESLATLMINDVEMLSPAIKHASWGTERKFTCSHYYVIFGGGSVEEGSLQLELSSVLQDGKLSIKHQVLLIQKKTQMLKMVICYTNRGSTNHFSALINPTGIQSR